MNIFNLYSGGESWPVKWLQYKIDDGKGGKRRLSAEEWLVLADMENANDQIQHIKTQGRTL